MSAGAMFSAWVPGGSSNRSILYSVILYVGHNNKSLGNSAYGGFFRTSDEHHPTPFQGLRSGQT